MKLERHASPLALLLFGGLIAVAATGALGDGYNTTLRANEAAGELIVDTREVARNGEFFETRILATPTRPFADLVIAVDSALWRDLTVNTMIPAAAEESFEDGAFRFSYGEWEAGAPIELKIDAQINPSLFAGTEGRISLFDGDERIVSVPISMRVMP